jgi:hypothetical protein
MKPMDAFDLHRSLLRVTPAEHPVTVAAILIRSVESGAATSSRQG